MEVRNFLQDYMLDRVHVIELHLVANKNTASNKEAQTIDKGIMDKKLCLSKYRYKILSSHSISLTTDTVNEESIIRPVSKLYINMWRDDNE